jgi:hypothetical protein
MRKLTKFKQDEVYASPSNAAGLYVVITRLDRLIYVFDEAFISLIRYAMATFCTSEMSTEQLALFLTYIDAFNGGTSFTSVTRALDDELLNLGLSVEDGSVYACGEASFFTFAPNGVDINL